MNMSPAKAPVNFTLWFGFTSN